MTHADDRRLVVGVEHVDELFGDRPVLVLILLDALFELGAAAQPRVRLVDVIDDLRGRRDDRLDRLADEHADRVDHLDRVRIGDRDHHARVAGIAAERQHDALAREVDRHLVDQLFRDVLGARQVAQVRQVELRGERERELVLVDELERDQHLADQPALLALLREPTLDRVARDATTRDEELAEQRSMWERDDHQ